MESDEFKYENSIQLSTILRRALWQGGWLLLWMTITIYIFKDSYNTEGLRHLRLIKSSAMTSGQLVNATEEPEDRDGGGVDWYCDLFYEYSVSGRNYKGEHRSVSGRAPDNVPMEITVEYVPGKPSISRIKGVGPTNYFSWLLYTFVAKSLIGIFTAFFAWIQLASLKQVLSPILKLKVRVPKDYDNSAS